MNQSTLVGLMAVEINDIVITSLRHVLYRIARNKQAL